MEGFKLYRAVSNAERDDIIISGNKFRTISGGLESKQFVTSKKDASIFKDYFSKKEDISYIIVEIEIIPEILLELHKSVDTDIVTVYTVYKSLLNKFNQAIININFL